MDGTIRATAIDLLSISGPGKTGNSWASLLILIFLHRNLSKEGLLISGKIPNLDAIVGGSGQPLVLGVESEGVDLRLAFELRLWLLKISIVPKFDDLIFSTGGNNHTVLRNVKSIDVSIMSLDGGNNSEQAGPDFESPVPTGGGKILGLVSMRESDLGDPVLVVMVLMRRLGGGDLALSQSVPNSSKLTTHSQK